MRKPRPWGCRASHNFACRHVPTSRRHPVAGATASPVPGCPARAALPPCLHMPAHDRLMQASDTSTLHARSTFSLQPHQSHARLGTAHRASEQRLRQKVCTCTQTFTMVSRHYLRHSEPASGPCGRAPPAASALLASSTHSSASPPSQPAPANHRPPPYIISHADIDNLITRKARCITTFRSD